MLPDTDLVDDILYEVFLLVTAKADVYQEGTNFLRWVKAIARLKVIEAIRNRRSSAALLSPETIDGLCDAAPEEGLDESQVRAIQACIDGLPRRWKTLVDMRYRLGCKPMEIAQRVGWQAQSVSVELSRARRALRQCLQRTLERALR